MSVGLGRIKWIFMKGRRIPIRIGTEAKVIARGIAGVSKKWLKRTAILEKQHFKISKAGKLLAPPVSSSGTEAMKKFMRQTGAVRISTIGPFAHFETAPTGAQRRFIRDILDSSPMQGQWSATKKGKWMGEITGDFEEDFMRRMGSNLSIFKPSAEGNKAMERAAKHFGFTENPRFGGFLTREGKMLDFSGHKFGGSGSMRELDHREVAQFVRNPARPAAKLKDIHGALWQHSLDRKMHAEQLHKITTLKQDIRKLRASGMPDRKPYIDRFNEEIKRLRALKKRD